MPSILLGVASSLLAGSLLCASFLRAETTLSRTLPKGFVFLKEQDPSIACDLRYATDNNFIGRPVTGYQGSSCILTHAAARALSKAQKELKKQGLGLLVYDAYRPQSAVDDFYEWSQNSLDQSQKALYYPNIEKSDLFSLGYLRRKSAHARGSTVDLTLINLTTGEPLDMGTPFDFLDPLSHPGNHRVSGTQFKNRMLLRDVMTRHGFKGIETEWWHFSLRSEPFAHTCFNFTVIDPDTRIVREL